MTPAIITTVPFSYHAATRTFVAEASDLAWPPGQMLSGFILRSTAPGQAEWRFSLAHTERDRDGNVVAWHYVGRDDGGILNVTIFND